MRLIGLAVMLTVGLTLAPLTGSVRRASGGAHKPHHTAGCRHVSPSRTAW